jgi:quercetin dioxygenase-like cupin family protein
MRYAIHSSDATTGSGDVHALFGPAQGCHAFEQRLVRVPAGGRAGGADGERDEILFVLTGAGRLTVEGDDHPLGPETAVFLACGTAWSLEAEEEEVTVVSVLVPDPAPAAAGHAVVDLGEESRHGATAGRQFLLGACPDVGCASATQFVGLVPPGRAPDHFHTYDEVIYVLDGQGRLFIGGEEAELGPGSCVHLPARTVHCLANTGDTELRLLGVFRPAGSPAEAYYPDGTPAVVPERS